MKRLTYLILSGIIVLSLNLNAQTERPKWELGGGFRLNYMGLDGGYEGAINPNVNYPDGYEFKLNYKDIGMDNYAPSMAIALGGRYKKWNLAFAGSRGSYKGEFQTNLDIVKDDIVIDSGSAVNGQIDMGIYALTTTFGLIQKQHDLGVGLGFLILNMGSSFKTTDTNGEILDIGGKHWFPMPFLAAAGRLRFGDFRLAGSGGGAVFIGEKDGLQYDVKYYTIDIRASYDFYTGENWSYSASLGFRKLFMDMYMEDDRGWAKEKDIYTGPYFSIRTKFSSSEMWTHVSRKERKANKGN